MQHSTRVAALAAALALAMVEPAAAQHPWRHGMLEFKSDAGIVAMVTHGFAERQGLKLEVVQFKSDIPALQALLAGELDSFEGGATPAILAAARGADVKIVGCSWPIVPHVIFARAAVASVQDLKGRTLAISSPGAFPDLLARAVLAKFGVAASELRFANLGSDVERFKAVAAGVADAAVVANEYTPIAAKQGIKSLVEGREVLPLYLRICLMSSGKVLSTRGEDAARFLAADMAALAYAMAHKTESLALTRELAHIKDDDPRPAYVFDWAKSVNAVDPELQMPAEKLAYMQEAAIETGSLAKPIDIAKATAPEVREKALTLVTK